MPLFDDDDDRQDYGDSYSSPRGTRRKGGGGGGKGGGGGGGRGGHGKDDDDWSIEDEGPDDRDLVPDEMPTVRCTNCRKLIFEDLVRCPYCRELQLEERQNKKPLWFIVTVVFCAISVSGIGLLHWLGVWPK